MLLDKQPNKIYYIIICEAKCLIGVCFFLCVCMYVCVCKCVRACVCLCRNAVTKGHEFVFKNNEFLKIF